MLSATNEYGESLDIQFLGSTAADALSLVLNARARVASMLDMLQQTLIKVGAAIITARRENPEAPQSASVTFDAQGFALDRADQLDRYVTGLALTALKNIPVVTPMVLPSSNVVLWPNSVWDEQAASWKLLSDFLGGGNKTFALERGTLGKVIAATTKMLADVDAKLAQRQPAVASGFPWGWLAGGLAAAATLVGVTVYATREKKPQRAPMHRRRALAGGRR